MVLLSMLVTLSEADATEKRSKAHPPKTDGSSPAANIKKKKVEIGDAVDFLKSYPVSKIKSGMVDSTSFVYRKLPPIPLEKWLASIMGDAPLEWKQDECAEYDSNIDDNSEHCASFLVTVRTPQWHCPEINLSFDIGADGAVYFLNDNSIVNDFGAKEDMQEIAELKETLEKVKAKATPNRPSILPAASLKGITDSDFINHARAIDVSSLYPSMPSERLDQWLNDHTANFPQHWELYGSAEGFNVRCGPKKIVISVSPENISNAKKPPYTIFADIGSWERGIERKPKLTIYREEPSDRGVSKWISLDSLSALQTELNGWNWNASVMARSSMPPLPIQAAPQATAPAKAPVIQNITKLGDYSRIRSTPSGHCYGLDLSLWQYGKQVFGTLFDPGGQCADSQEPTYVVRDAKYDPKTGKIEFWSYGTPGYKFVGKMDEKMITGQFIGMTDLLDEKEVILKRSRGNFDTFLETDDSNKNLEIWCKEYAPQLRLIEKEGLEKLCKSLGVK